MYLTVERSRRCVVYVRDGLQQRARGGDDAYVMQISELVYVEENSVQL